MALSVSFQRMFAGVVSRLISTMSSSHSMPPAAGGGVVVTLARFVVVLELSVVVRVIPEQFSVH